MKIYNLICEITIDSKFGRKEYYNGRNIFKEKY